MKIDHQLEITPIQYFSQECFLAIKLVKQINPNEAQHIMNSLQVEKTQSLVDYEKRVFQ